MSEQNGTDSTKNLFEQVDNLYEECKYQEIYLTLLKIEDKKSNPDVLWRLARACYQMASPLESNNPKKKNLLDEGLKYAKSAYEIRPNEFNVVKWVAALTGSRTDFLRTKEKIEQGNLFKEFLDKALAMNPNDYALLHMRGRFAFSVANLSWIERKMASTFFATPPEATYDDAIRDFTAVDKIKPEWLENMVYLAKSHLAKGEKEKAVRILKSAVQIKEDTEDGEETGALREAKELLKKHAKSG